MQLLGCGTAAACFLPSLLAFKSNSIMKRNIPSSGEALPVVGLGTWQTFDVGVNREQRRQLAEVLKEMKALGGAMIDSSPMYGTSEQVVGDLCTEQQISEHFFYATKVWISGRQAGIDQMQSSMRKMKRSTMDLMQIHNLVDWETHIKTLRDWKGEGKIRYWGITHYTNDSHEKLEQLIRQERPDFVQFNYSINERNAEKRLLDAAKDHEVAVIINRPYDGGNLFRKVRGKELPDWCSDIDINSWGQYFLKYILSYKAVNCVIPGTSKVKHVIDNMQAGYGRLPDVEQRLKMVHHFNNL
ncbi:MAG: aldo/keto reductase [Flavobacteriaceae bacterium]|nr:aldo/keto reductase [Bacteroidia bacterium]NNF75537.1 aldo/keto reductase [Flavobacteriaceae bacterium]NNK72841.1 aldo/keto reductase [Flavobacteriaceae bacterium]